MDFLSLHGARIADRLTAAPECATRNDPLIRAAPAASGERERHLAAFVHRRFRTWLERRSLDPVRDGGESGRAGQCGSGANAGAFASNPYARLRCERKADSAEVLWAGRHRRRAVFFVISGEHIAASPSRRPHSGCAHARTATAVRTHEVRRNRSRVTRGISKLDLH
ncbi:hypothetical protein [Paraburkholderia caballeronis]|uniref:hypothetical protein n=1 Tax=Paraburkholderia caballeronis TaxID=416943 RepID=UPI00115FA78D|nr:hypothetical protein [Paraburkholderia caballeronis]